MEILCCICGNTICKLLKPSRLQEYQFCEHCSKKETEYLELIKQTDEFFKDAYDGLREN